MQLCGVLNTGAVLLAHPKYSLSQDKYLCTLYFAGNEASLSLVLHSCYIHNIVSQSISSILIVFIMLSYTKLFSLLIMLILLSYTQLFSIFILFTKLLYTQIYSIIILFTMLSYTQFYSMFILFIMLLYTKFYSIFFILLIMLSYTQFLASLFCS